MQLSRRGVFRNAGSKVLFASTDEVRLHEGDTGVVVRVSSVRYPKSSYDYWLRLEPKEILRTLLTMRPEEIADAVAELREEFFLPGTIPEIVKQLTAGAMSPPATPSLFDE